MTGAKHRSAWIWLAVAALAIAVAARAQSGIHSARAYTAPVLQYLAAHATDQPTAGNSVHHLLFRRNLRKDGQNSNPGALGVMLPVFFVGLISPLNLVSPRSPGSVDRTPAAPELPSSFQRPPPQLL